jgi:hypothetical protein
MIPGRVVALAACALALALALPATPAAANIVNVVSVISVEPEEGLSGSLTGALDLRRGRASRLVLSAAPVLRYRLRDHLFIGYGSGEYDEDNDTVNKIFGHARYRLRLMPRLTGEVFTQHETNPGLGQAYRGLLGLGPLFDLVTRKTVRVAWGVAYMLEYELVDDGVMCPPARPGCAADPGLQHRVSSYVTGSYQLDDNLQVVDTLYVQPLVRDPVADFRLLNDAQLAVLLTRSVSFSTTLSWAYDRAPNPSIYARYDVTLRSAITVQF